MSRPPAPLPDGLRGRAFGLAGAKERKIPGRLRSRQLSSPISGARTDGPCRTVEERAGALTCVVPKKAAFCGPTAATILGLPLPSWLEADPTLHVLTPRKSPTIRRMGVAGHRGLEGRKTLSLRGLRLTTPVDTWLDLAATLGLDDLVTLLRQRTTSSSRSCVRASTPAEGNAAWFVPGKRSH